MRKPIQVTATKISEDDASILTLLMAMLHITGDTSILKGPVKPQTAILGELQGFLSEKSKAAVRAQALDVLKAYRDRG